MSFLKPLKEAAFSKLLESGISCSKASDLRSAFCSKPPISSMAYLALDRFTWNLGSCGISLDLTVKLLGGCFPSSLVLKLWNCFVIPLMLSADPTIAASTALSNPLPILFVCSSIASSCCKMWPSFCLSYWSSPCISTTASLYCLLIWSSLWFNALCSSAK